MNEVAFQPGPLAERVNKALAAARDEKVLERIWRKDASLWKSDEQSARVINNSLGWLTVAEEMIGVADELIQFADSIRSRGFRHVMVCGIGGSSLCPEVLAKTFGQQQGYPELLVLDSTDPDVIAALSKRIDVERCLFVIASKSGSTIEPNVFYKYWYDEVSKRRENPGENFIAITDPGSPLVETAAKLNFHRTFLNQPDIGGRYSALSYFGMVPAALMGLDIRKLLEATRISKFVKDGPSVELGVIFGECANAGRDKLTLVIDPSIETLGLWIEQLIAESTGKEGKGILPVNGELLGSPEVYGDDRLFLSISVGPIAWDTKAKLLELVGAGHPVIFHEMDEVYDLGAEFFLWEFATAVAGWRLAINPFDQPNVQEAKDATKELLETFERRGHFDPWPDTATEPLPINPGDYIAFLAFIEETPEIDQHFQKLRTQVRDATKCAVTIGYGPRFLHSTGQLHKGGPNTGVFFQILANDNVDFAVPGESYTFSILKQAQALGDLRVLKKRERRVVSINPGKDTRETLDQVASIVGAALRGRPS